MKTLLKGIHIIYPGSQWHNERLHILVEYGMIIALGPEALSTPADNVIEGTGIRCFPGLVDPQCSSGEPGHEYKEDLESLANAAAAGGFAHVMMLPGTEPATDHSSQVRALLQRSGGLSARIHPYGAISKGLNGADLSEMYDMHQSGAIAFSDGKNAVSDVNMMKRALDYVRGFDGLVCAFPIDDRINPGGFVHEGPVTTRLGLKSTPALAEELMLNRDLYLLDYTKSRLHVSTVSSSGSVALLKQAKDHGLDVSAAVALPNLLLCDEHLEGFDANYKTNPPLRSKDHQQALIEGLKAGTIDMICTDHTPESIEEKDVELDHAASGMTMLETALSLAFEHLQPELGDDVIANSMSLNARRRFGLEMPSLESGAFFDFTVFDPDSSWNYNAAACQSKSHNSPWFGKTIKGQVISFES